MMKIAFCLRRLPQLTPQEFQRHWYDVHAPLVRKYQAVLRIVRYVQFHGGPISCGPFEARRIPTMGWRRSGTRVARHWKRWGKTRTRGRPVANCSTTRGALSISPARRSGQGRREKSFRSAADKCGPRIRTMLGIFCRNVLVGVVAMPARSQSAKSGTEPRSSPSIRACPSGRGRGRARDWAW
jgi:hypothetical protein